MLGLKSFAGGNVPAAIDRLQHSKELLLQAAGIQHHQQQGEGTMHVSGPGQDKEEVSGTAAAAQDQQQQLVQSQQQGQQLTPEVACRLGAVCGSQADCWKRLGQLEAAQQLYAESIGYLEPFADQDPEVWHALCVSINKSGDLHFLQQEWGEARGLYEKALVMRVGVWDQLKQQTGGGGWQGEQQGGGEGRKQQAKQQGGDPQQQQQQQGEETETAAPAAVSSCSAGLDVVTSHIKVADVCMVRACVCWCGGRHWRQQHMMLVTILDFVCTVKDNIDAFILKK
jgi:tetratricopeptide (TPR) repeat protein